jgi:hypothetical protein
MNIYKVTQNINNGYDTYDSMVVVAETEQDAREICPDEFTTHHHDGTWYGTFNDGGEYKRDGDEWVPFNKIHKLVVTLIGIATPEMEKGVVVASFNAG